MSSRCTSSPVGKIRKNFFYHFALSLRESKSSTAMVWCKSCWKWSLILIKSYLAIPFCLTLATSLHPLSVHASQTHSCSRLKTKTQNQSNLHTNRKPWLDREAKVNVLRCLLRKKWYCHWNNCKHLLSRYSRVPNRRTGHLLENEKKSYLYTHYVLRATLKSNDFLD